MPVYLHASKGEFWQKRGLQLSGSHAFHSVFLLLGSQHKRPTGSMPSLVAVGLVGILAFPGNLARVIKELLRNCSVATLSVRAFLNTQDPQGLRAEFTGIKSI